MLFFTFKCAVSSSENIIQFTIKGVPFQMVKVEGGSDGTYYIGKTEVTQALWKAVMDSNPDYIYLASQQAYQQTLPPAAKAERGYAARGVNRSKGYLHSGSNGIKTVG